MTTTLEEILDQGRRDDGAIFSVTIASGDSLSAAIDLGTRVLSRIEFPAAWTAANVTFQVSTDGVTYLDLFNEGGEISLQAGANRSITLEGWSWIFVRYLKIRSGTSAAPIAQAAARTINLFSGYKQ